MARLLLVVALVAVSVLALANPAQAHPLGNFTVNHYARLEVSSGFVRVLYVLDLAEIPAFQERREVTADPEAYAARRAREIAGGLRLTVDGQELDLLPIDQILDQPPGQGGLTTLRVAIRYEASLPDVAPGPPHQATFADTNQPDRIGWREVVVRAAGDARIVASDVPDADITDELRSYPEDLIQSPLDRRAASFSYTPGSRPAPPPALEGSAGSGGTTDGFAALVTRTDLTPLALAGLLALGLGFGVVHAAGPGHGKTIMAAYLVGTRGRARDAVLLGVIVSIMHTASVLVLGLVLLRVDRSIASEAAYPVLTVVSGVAVTGVGGWLVVGRWRRARAGTGRHDHDHGEHDQRGHDHGEHGHDHGEHGHSHALPEGVAPLSRRGLVALGVSGGLFPSPSAVLVVVGAVGLGRAGLGLALLAAFSVGLAVALTVVGLGLVFGRGFIERRGFARRLRFLPLAGALALVGLGLAVILRGVIELS